MAPLVKFSHADAEWCRCGAILLPEDAKKANPQKCGDAKPRG
jgi:hypothetical protein